MIETNYLIIKNNVLDTDHGKFIHASTLTEKYKGSIAEYAKREVEKTDSELEVGDVVYELKPVLKIHAVVTASKIKSL